MGNKADKRKRIIEIATKLFVERGFHGSPTSLIAKESGIATGTLFNYFKTKDILINEIFKEIKKEQKKAILNGVEKEIMLKGKLNKIWNNIIVWGIKNPEKRKFIEYFSNSSYISDETKIEIQNNYKFLLDIFREIIANKEITNTNELMLLFNFIGSCLFTGRYFYITKEDFDFDKSNEPFERFCKSIDLTERD
jgi:AcrR family transcriptional regulator